MANDITTYAGVQAEITRVQALIESAPAGSQKIGEASRSGAISDLSKYLQMLYDRLDNLAAETVETIKARSVTDGSSFGV